MKCEATDVLKEAASRQKYDKVKVAHRNVESDAQTVPARRTLRGMLCGRLKSVATEGS